MKLVNKLLSTIGYVLYNKRFHEKRFMRRNEFEPLKQLFNSYYHEDFTYILVGGDGDTIYDPLFHLVSKNKTRKILLESAPDCFEASQLQEKITSVDLIHFNTRECVRGFIDKFDFDKVKPKLISFEHGYKDGGLDMDLINRAIKKLMDAGYKVFIQSYDVIAYI